MGHITIYVNTKRVPVWTIHFMAVFPMFSRYKGFSHLFMWLLDDKLHRSFSFQGKRKILFDRYHAFNNNTPQLQEVMFFGQNCALMLPFVFIFSPFIFDWLKLLGRVGRNSIPHAKTTLSEIPQAVAPIFSNLLVWRCCFELQQSHGQIFGGYLTIQQQSDQETSFWITTNGKQPWKVSVV